VPVGVGKAYPPFAPSLVLFVRRSGCSSLALPRGTSSADRVSAAGADGPVGPGARTRIQKRAARSDGTESRRQRATGAGRDQSDDRLSSGERVRRKARVRSGPMPAMKASARRGAIRRSSSVEVVRPPATLPRIP
jgi:hypothetical protein